MPNFKELFKSLKGGFLVIRIVKKIQITLNVLMLSQFDKNTSLLIIIGGGKNVFH